MSINSAPFIPVDRKLEKMVNQGKAMEDKVAIIDPYPIVKIPQGKIRVNIPTGDAFATRQVIEDFKALGLHEERTGFSCVDKCGGEYTHGMNEYEVYDF